MKVKLLDTGQEVSSVFSLHLTLSLRSVYDTLVIICPATSALRVNSLVELVDDDNNSMLKGFVGSLSPSKTDDIVIYTIVSFSNLLIHGCPIVSTGEFISSTSTDILKALLTPYSLSVDTDSDGVLLNKYNVNLDMPLVNTVNELSVVSGEYTPTASINGIYLFRGNPDDKTTNGVMLHDGNCQFTFIVSNEFVFSEHEVVGESSFAGNIDTTQYNHTTNGLLPFTKKSRTVYDGLSTLELCTNKVQRISDVHNSSYENLTARLEGIYDFINKGELVSVHSDQCRINDVRMIETVEIFKDTKGEDYTLLSLCFPSKYGGVASSISEWIK